VGFLLLKNQQHLILPALNTGVVASAIAISAPVCWFLPLRAALLKVHDHGLTKM